MCWQHHFISVGLLNSNCLFPFLSLFIFLSFVFLPLCSFFVPSILFKGKWRFKSELSSQQFTKTCLCVLWRGFYLLLTTLCRVRSIWKSLRKEDVWSSLLLGSSAWNSVGQQTCVTVLYSAQWANVVCLLLLLLFLIQGIQASCDRKEGAGIFSLPYCWKKWCGLVQLWV